MNNRDYKILGKDGIYHVFNRGVGKIDIFKDDADKKRFLLLLKENLLPEMVPISERERSPGGYLRKLLPPGCFTLLSYCLMPNHFHLLIRQNNELALSKFMLKVCGSYSKYFNLKNERVGSLFQDQYKAVKIEGNSQLLWLSAYIHNNPKVAGLSKDLTDYSWSSYLDYVNLRAEILVDKSFILNMLSNRAEIYKQFITESYNKIKQHKDLSRLFLD